ncbi:MAG: threonine synthase [Patescibacteria group bacterium]
MKFYSTNKQSKPVDFKTALLRGLADDGGLFMPEKFGRFLPSNFSEILGKFIDIPRRQLNKIIQDSFNFPVPLVRLSENLYILELFHGPTFSFKDFGARFMARTMNYYLQKSRQTLNIIVATSGDTGSAVASGFYGLSNIKVFVLYPSKRISELQEKQIATFDKNITALEVKGDFDDCQRLAKQALGDNKLREKNNFSSANSINIGRLLPQMFYYFSGYQQLQILYPKPHTPNPVFIVPSGNFGNLTAGFFAKKLGLRVKKFIAAVNINSGVPQYLKNGRLPVKKTKMTFSNAMDVGNPSNWARVLDLYGISTRNINANDAKFKKLKQDLEAIAVSEVETAKTIRTIYKKYGYILDPHTAVGVAVAIKSKNSQSPKIILATAHPAKFKEIVEKAIGRKIALPKDLAMIAKKPKKSILIGKEYNELKKILIGR